jgi:tetratricopeptide (TPR) repeat protein
MLGLQNELSADIARQIHLRLSPERLTALDRRHTKDPEAYLLYLQALFLWNQLRPETNQRAIEYYTRATKRDPDYALAWAGLALVYAGAPINADAPPKVMWPLARQAADRAMRVDSTLAEVQTAAGMVRFWLDWDWADAETAFRKAVSLDSNYALAQRMVGITLGHRGDHAGAREPMRRLRELEPLYGMNWALSAQVAFNARDYEGALEFARRATVIAPGFYVGDYHVAMAAEQLGRYDLALETLNKSLSNGNTNSKLHALRGYVLARTDHASEARDVLQMLRTVAEVQYIPPYAMALVHAGLGDRDAVFAWLDRAYAAHDVHLVALPTDAKWDPFREDARFNEIVKRCGFATAS